MSDQLKKQIIDATDFLNYDASIKVRVSYILNGLTQQKKCLECNIPLKHKNSLNVSSDFCSASCSKKNIRTKQKRKKTNQDRYGVDNPFLNSEKIKSATFKKYGVSNVAHCDDVRKKISVKNKQNARERLQKSRNTMLEKYDFEHFSQTEMWNQKVRSINQKQYGVDWLFQSDDIKKQIKKTNLKYYGFENASQNQEIIEKISDTKNRLYGDKKYNNRIQANQTMVERYGAHSQQKHWDDITRNLMFDCDSLKEFVADKTINEAADILNIAPTTLRNKLKKYDIDFYKKRKNQYENFIKNILNQNKVEYITNDRELIAPKELDFVLPEFNIGIECNGIFWHSEIMGKDKNYHLQKTLACNKMGFRLVHFWDYQIDQSPDIIKSMINHLTMSTSFRIYARNTNIIPIVSSCYRNFLNKNHLQGAVNSTIRLGLEHDGQIVGVIGAGVSRFNRKEFELHRLAFSRNISVVGGASKLFKSLIQKIESGTIISYADRDYSDGQVYEKLGFTRTSHGNPSYRYFKNRKVENRIKFQKHKLSSILSEYDENLTEWENMKQNGYNRFWTTGNFRYEYKI